MKNAPRIIRLRLRNSSLMVQSRVYDTQKEMLNAIRKDVIGGVANSTLACCVHATRSTVMQDSIAAIVFFSRTHLDAGTVAHEMVHAGHNILERRHRGGRRLTKDSKLEEELADITGELVNGFYKKYGKV